MHWKKIVLDIALLKESPRRRSDPSLPPAATRDLSQGPFWSPEGTCDQVYATFIHVVEDKNTGKGKVKRNSKNISFDY